MVTFRRIKRPAGVKRRAGNYGFTFYDFCLLRINWVDISGSLRRRICKRLGCTLHGYVLPLSLSYQNCRIAWLLIRRGWDLWFLSVWKIGVSDSCTSCVKLVPRSCFRQSHGRRYSAGPGVWVICADMGQWVLASGVTCPVLCAHMATSPR